MPMANYISPLSNDSLSNLCKELGKNNSINPADFERYSVKRGLRNQDGTGVMAGLTRICNVQGYYVSDGERVPSIPMTSSRMISPLKMFCGNPSSSLPSFQPL